MEYLDLRTKIILTVVGVLVANVAGYFLIIFTRRYRYISKLYDINWNLYK